MGAKRWNTCNVLALGAETRHLWQFEAKGEDFKLDRELTVRGGDSLPDAVKKSWSSLWQSKLNVACLPPDRVFLRVAQFPKATFAETVQMVDLQMEKLSPMPVGQIVWSIHCLDHPAGTQQTVIVTIAARDAVEAFLGKLEGDGFLPDRLEICALDQLLATEIPTDGAWIYPETLGGAETALVAWWYGGVLRSLDILTLPTTHFTPGSANVSGLAEQISQMAWSGEVDGWLTSPPRWHLVVPQGVTPVWEMALRNALNEPIHLVAPAPSAVIAARTAKRAATQEASTLLPPENAVRYRQQFADRLWMRGLAAAVVLYLAGVAIYFSWLGGSWWQTSRVEKQVAGLSQTYTNALQLRARYNVLKDRQELKYAALDCWRLAADKWPGDATLEGFSFIDGERLTLNGTAPQDAVSGLIDFYNDIRKAKLEGKEIFKPTSESLTYRAGAGGTVSWNFSLELKRTEIQ